MKELSVRKSTRLKGYDYSKAGCYFITICVKDKHEIFGQIVGDAHLGVPSFNKLVPHSNARIMWMWFGIIMYVSIFAAL